MTDVVGGDPLRIIQITHTFPGDLYAVVGSSVTRFTQDYVNLFSLEMDRHICQEQGELIDNSNSHLQMLTQGYCFLMHITGFFVFCWESQFVHSFCSATVPYCFHFVSNVLRLHLCLGRYFENGIWMCSALELGLKPGQNKLEN